tara:strand:+ start:345 stop:494 length:150 start_codon:yes stop_codon:yes gene_type:complete
MKRYIIAFLLALVLSIGLRLTELDLFLVGWFSCVGWYTVILIYQEYEPK